MRNLSRAMALIAGLYASMAIGRDAVPVINMNDPTASRHLHRGGPGTRAHKRAALKKRNQARNRRAHRV